MTLPQLSHPLFDITIPSTGKKIRFRRYLVLEEKILLYAKQEKTKTAIVQAIRQVIQNCAVDEFNINDCASYDFDYIFLKLHAASVNNIISVMYNDKEDEKQYKLEIDLDGVNVVFPDDWNTDPVKIKADENVTMLLKYPTVGDMFDITENLITNLDLVDQLLVKCISSIYDANEVYDEFTQEELIQWIQGLNPEVYREVKKFYDRIPIITHTIEFTNSLNNTKEVVLRGIEDFFMW